MKHPKRLKPVKSSVPRTTLVEWDPLHFSPWVYDPVAQWLAAVYRGDAPTPGGRLVFSVRDMALEAPADPDVMQWLRDCLDQLKEGLRQAIKENAEYGLQRYGVVRRRIGKRATADSKKFQKGGCLEGETDRYYLRIPHTTGMWEEALGRVLEKGIGFPVVARQKRHGKSHPLYILGDTTKLYARAAKVRAHAAMAKARTRAPGRPLSIWRTAYELERGIQQEPQE